MELIGRFEFKEVIASMSGTHRPTGHLQVKSDSNGARSYFAFWRDEHGARGGKRLGPAHVRDSGAIPYFDGHRSMLVHRDRIALPELEEEIVEA
jgi:hypothetical protein